LAHRNSSATVRRVRHCPPVIYSTVRFIEETVTTVEEQSDKERAA
jgi:hypothetical protein